MNLTSAEVDLEESDLMTAKSADDKLAVDLLDSYSHYYVFYIASNRTTTVCCIVRIMSFLTGNAINVQVHNQSTLSLNCMITCDV